MFRRESEREILVAIGAVAAEYGFRPVPQHPLDIRVGQVSESVFDMPLDDFKKRFPRLVLGADLQVDRVDLVICSYLDSGGFDVRLEDWSLNELEQMASNADSATSPPNAAPRSITELAKRVHDMFRIVAEG